MAIAVSLYLASGEPFQVADVSSAVTMVGIVSGLVGADLILVMVLLAARVPLIDRVFGQDVAMSLHGRLGAPAFYLVLAHVGLLVLGYSLADGTNVIGETAALLGTADMPLAFIGLGLLVAVIGTSVVVIRHKLPYEAWHLVHLLSYASVLAALPHQLSVGAVLGAGTGQRAYWIALYVVSLGSIAYYRLALPMYRSLRHSVRVAAVKDVAPGVVSIHLSGRHLGQLGTHGGQYAVWRFWTRGTWWHAHPLSFSSMPDDTSARITVRDLGEGSRSIGRVGPGARVSFAGPYGLFTKRARSAPYLSIVAAGIGITPIRTLLEDSPLRPGEATVLLRAGDPGQTYLWNEVISLADQVKAPVYWSIGPRPAGGGGWVSGVDQHRGVGLISVFPHLLESDLYICGPRAWADQVLGEARGVGLHPERIHLERFDW